MTRHLSATWSSRGRGHRHPVFARDWSGFEQKHLTKGNFKTHQPCILDFCTEKTIIVIVVFLLFVLHLGTRATVLSNRLTFVLGRSSITATSFLKDPLVNMATFNKQVPYPNPKNTQGVPKKKWLSECCWSLKVLTKNSVLRDQIFPWTRDITWERFILLSLSIKEPSNINFFCVDVLKEFFSRTSLLNSHLDNLKNGHFEKVELCCWSHFQFYRNLSKAEFLFQE